MSNMYNIPKFWINLKGLACTSNLNIMEACTHVFCMQGALTFHRWLLDVIPAAVNCISHNTWLDKLARDVRRAIERKKNTTFDSADYLPNLFFHKVYPFKSTVIQYEATELIISVVSLIVRHWLGFPSNEFSLLQLFIIHIITSKSLPSVLFLDKFWDMYQSSFTTVFNKWSKQSSKTQIKLSLENFEEWFTHHPFATTDSLEYHKLGLFSELITQWTEKYGINTETVVSHILHAFLLLLLNICLLFSSSSKNP